MIKNIIIYSFNIREKQKKMNRIEIYNKLNRVKPSNKILKYPFNFWTPAKIKFTQKEIELKFKNPNKSKDGQYQNKGQYHKGQQNNHNKDQQNKIDGGKPNKIMVF